MKKSSKNATGELCERRLLKEMTSRFVKYDRARDAYVGFLQKLLEKAGVDYEAMPRWGKLHTRQDELFCRVREIVRIVKDDPYCMWC